MHFFERRRTYEPINKTGTRVASVPVVQRGCRLEARCTGRLWALREERGQPARAGRVREGNETKRERVISPHPSLIFIQTRESSVATRASSPPFFFFPLSSSIILRLALCPFHYLFPFTSFHSHRTMPHLISSLTYCIYYGRATGGG